MRPLPDVGMPVLTVIWHHASGYGPVAGGHAPAPAVRFGLTETSSVVKSPTDVSFAPTFVLAPFVLSRTSMRSGNAPPVTVRVQNVSVAPFRKLTCGVINQLLIVPTDPVLL